METLCKILLLEISWSAHSQGLRLVIVQERASSWSMRDVINYFERVGMSVGVTFERFRNNRGQISRSSFRRHCCGHRNTQRAACEFGRMD